MPQDSSTLEPPAQVTWLRFLAPSVFLLLTIAFFNTALFDTGTIIASNGTDVALQFLPWRKFGFDQLRHGNLALWNPHIYGGTPYFAGFQSALLYPPNWLHLFMPVGLAINWINALHLFLAGLFTYLWCRHRGASRGGGMLAGIMFMFSGPYFLHLYAGHLPHLAVMVWAPLLFLAIDLVMDRQLARGTLLGIFVMAMFLLAGHPQYVYYTGMAAAVYVLIALVHAKSIPIALAGCVMIVLGGAALAAIQLLPGIDFVSESVRSGGTDYRFSAMFGFPPENLATLLSPNVLGHLSLHDGDKLPFTYFGRCYLWEVSLFVSVTGLFLALYGAVVAVRRKQIGSIVMVVVCLTLALGAHTPLHHFIYSYLPGFASFRGSTKFNYLVVLFLSLLAAQGFDHLLLAKKPSLSVIVSAVVLLLFVGGLALIIHVSGKAGADGYWARSMRAALDTGYESMEVYLPKALLTDDFFKQAAATASTSLAWAMVPAGLVLLCIVLIRVNARFAYGLIVLAAAELFLYCYFGTRASMGNAPPFPEAAQQIVRDTPPDQRLLFLAQEQSNFGMWYGFDDLWGYDPGVLKRYAQLVFASQGINPGDATQYINFQKANPAIFSLLRCGAVVLPDSRKIQMPTPLTVTQLIPTAFVLPPNQILPAIQSDHFDPRRMVLLETAPSIKPVPSADPGNVKITRQSTDWLEIEATVNSDAVLLVTNAYSKGWRATALSAGPQDHYDVMPADWALQAIPLRAGKHHFRLEFRPGSFVLGKWVSLLSLLLYGIGAARYFVNKRRRIIPAVESPV